MTTLPIALCLYTSTKGHWGQSDLYAATLNHLDRQLPLKISFGALYAHIKVGVDAGQQEIGNAMEADLIARGFTVEKTTADWSRGTSHGQAYLTDMRKSSVSKMLQSQPYTLILEDDGTMSSEAQDLVTILYRMIGFLESSPDTLSARFLRREDWATMDHATVLKTESDHFYSAHFNLQPSLVRSRDWYLVHLIIEQLWEKLSPLQCELVLRLAFNQLSRSPLQHVVWLPHFAHSVHLGVSDYLAVKKSLGL